MSTNDVMIKGYIRNGELVIDLPKDVQDGEIEVRVTVKTPADVTPDAEPLWTDDELAALIRPEPKTGAEIVALGHTGGWEHKGITDSVAWVQEQRRKRREQRGW